MTSIHVLPNEILIDIFLFVPFVPSTDNDTDHSLTKLRLVSRSFNSLVQSIERLICSTIVNNQFGRELPSMASQEAGFSTVASLNRRQRVVYDLCQCYHDTWNGHRDGGGLWTYRLGLSLLYRLADCSKCSLATAP